MGLKSFWGGVKGLFTGQRYGGSSFYAYSPVSLRDLSIEAVPVISNSASMACVAWMQRNFTEGQLVLKEISGKTIKRDHDLLKLLRYPNQHYTGMAMWQAVVYSLCDSGSAYLYKGRDSTGKVKQLWWLDHNSITPRNDDAGNEFITRYERRVNNQTKNYSPDDIIHFRFSLNPENNKVGLAPINSGYAEVATDNKCTNYTNVLIGNMGGIGAVISPKDAMTSVDELTRKEIQAWYRGSVTGDKAGSPLIASGPIEVSKLGLSPEQLALSSIRDVVEDRICALFGISPMVVGLTSGGKHKTYANYGEAMQAALYNNIIPTHKGCVDVMNLMLKDEFHGLDKFELVWTYEDVKYLQEEIGKLWMRVVTAFKAGLISQNEARIKIGYDSLGMDGDVWAPITAMSGRADAAVLSDLNDPGYTLDRPLPANNTGGNGLRDQVV